MNNSSIHFRKKYIKYKLKYLQLKNQFDYDLDRTKLIKQIMIEYNAICVSDQFIKQSESSENYSSSSSIQFGSKFPSIKKSGSKFPSIKKSGSKSIKKTPSAKKIKPTKNVKPTKDAKTTKDIIPAKKIKPTKNVTPTKDIIPTKDVKTTKDIKYLEL